MTEDRKLQFDKDFERTLRLRDGTKVLIRCVRPDDKDILLAGFDKLSEQSRYRRFLSPKSSLTEPELAYLTEVDGTDHFAVVVVLRKIIGEAEGVGVARFVRHADKPDTAEPAVTVADEYQGKGLGTILLQLLCDAAAERDVVWFRSELLAQNTGMKKLIEEISPEASFEHIGDGIMAATFRLPEPMPELEEALGILRTSPLYRLFSLIAGDESGVSVSQRHTVPPEPPA